MNRNIKLECEKCGPVKYGLVNGYSFGDTLLEDVMFQIRIINGKYSIKIDDDSKDYFESFNSKKWFATALNYVKRTDLLVCPKCEDYTIPVNQQLPKPKYIKVPVTKFSDLMEKLIK